MVGTLDHSIVQSVSSVAVSLSSLRIRFCLCSGSWLLELGVRVPVELFVPGKHECLARVTSVVFVIQCIVEARSMQIVDSTAMRVDGMLLGAKVSFFPIYLCTVLSMTGSLNLVGKGCGVLGVNAKLH